MKLSQFITAAMLACTGLAAQAQSETSIPITGELQGGCYWNMNSNVDFGNKSVGLIETPIDMGVYCSPGVTYTIQHNGHAYNKVAFLVVGTGGQVNADLILLADESRALMLNKVGLDAPGITMTIAGTGDGTTKTHRGYLQVVPLNADANTPYTSNAGAFTSSFNLRLTY